MDDFADIVPTPQNDGPAPVVRIKYSPAFEEAMGRFRTVLVRGDLDERALRLTELVIEHNAANYTAWAYRRRCLEVLKSAELWERELDWSSEITRDNPKNYQVWFHRRRVVQGARADAREELDFVAECLEEDAKNYHAWGYRQWLLRTYNLWDDELDYCTSLLDEDCFNNSAWNQRMFVLQETGAISDDAAVRRELELAIGYLDGDLHNASPWHYALGLVEARKSPDDTAWLAAQCRTVLAKAPACVPAAATLVDLCTLTNTPADREEAAGLCKSLATGWDQIRCKYWAMREMELLDGAPSMPGSGDAQHAADTES